MTRPYRSAATCAQAYAFAVGDGVAVTFSLKIQNKTGWKQPGCPLVELVMQATHSLEDPAGAGNKEEGPDKPRSPRYGWVEKQVQICAGGFSTCVKTFIKAEKCGYAWTVLEGHTRNRPWVASGEGPGGSGVGRIPLVVGEFLPESGVGIWTLTGCVT